jgi:hypothetical protein
MAAEMANDLFKYLMWGPFSSILSSMLSLSFMIINECPIYMVNATHRTVIQLIGIV